jgi:ABC-type uncharacterized transport system involved in gliding motility auxiliary subunit
MNTARSHTFWRLVAALGVVSIAAAALLYAFGARAWPAVASVGAVLLVVTVAVHARATASFLRRRDTRRGADATLAILFLAAILAVVQATSVRHSYTFDLTRNQRHSLAPQTIALLDSLDRDVDVTGFFRQASAMRAGADDLLSLYARRSPRFRYRLVDPDRQPDLAHRLNASLDEMVVQAGDVRRIVRNPSEETLTNALLGVTRSGPRAVYVVVGHGEKDIASTEREGYSAAAQGLASQGYRVRPVSLLGGARVPSDCDVLVVAGPRSDYFADEAAAIDGYLRGGGSVLFLLDPRTELPRLAALLGRFHLGLVDAVVLDELVLDAGDRSFDATVAKIRRYEAHAITRDFNFVTMYARARPVIITSDTTAAGLEAQYLCITDDTSWGETDMTTFASGRATRDGSDVAGPLPIAAVATLTPLVAGPERVEAGRASRVVLIGDSDFANNVLYGVLGNSDFLLNTIAFLSEDENLIRIRPRRFVGESVYITERQGRLVFLVCLVLLPLTPVVTGAVVVARRRRL